MKIQQRQVKSSEKLQQYSNDNAPIIMNNNIINDKKQIQITPSANLNSKKKHQVFKHQENTFVNQIEQQTKEKQKLNNYQSYYVRNGNILSYKQKQKIESCICKSEDNSGQLKEQEGDIRQIIYKQIKQPQSQRLLKETNQQNQTHNNQTVKATYQNIIGYNANQTKCNAAPKFNYNQSNYQNEDQPKERQQFITNRVCIVNSYTSEQYIEGQSSPKTSDSKNVQTLNVNIKNNTIQLNQFLQKNSDQTQVQFQKTQNNDNQSNQMLQDISSTTSNNNQTKYFQNNQVSSSTLNLPKKTSPFKLMKNSDKKDNYYPTIQPFSDNNLEIFTNDLSQFRQTKQIKRSPIKEKQVDTNKSSTNSLYSYKNNQERQLKTVVCIQNKERKGDTSQSNKQRLNKTLDRLMSKKGQIEPFQLLSFIDVNRLTQLRYQLLESNDQSQIRQNIEGNKSIQQHKFGVGYISDALVNFKSDYQKEKSEVGSTSEKQIHSQRQYDNQQQKPIQNNLILKSQKTKGQSKKGSLKLKKDEKNLGSSFQVQLIKLQKQLKQRKTSINQVKLSDGRIYSLKRIPLKLNSYQKISLKENFVEEDGESDFVSLGNLSDNEKEFDNLKFEKELEHEYLIDQNRKTSYNSTGICAKKVPSIEDFCDENIQNNRDIILPTVTLLRSVYEGRPKTIFFEYPDCCFKKRERANRTNEASPNEVKKWNLTYRMNDCNNPFQCVMKSFEAGGFVETASNTQWNGYWASNRLDFIKNLNSYQKTNHFSGCWNLGRKDLLWIKVSQQKRKFALDYDFLPRTMLLASEWDRFTNLLEDNPEQLWIVKPVASCCGKGVHVVQKKCKIGKSKRRNYLASEYISNPHLINDTKYDLRIYVLVTSYDPLRIYIFQDGLARFATVKYDIHFAGHQRQRFMHLTNYSVNKNSEHFVRNNDANDSATGSKWSLKAWKDYLVQTIGQEGKDQLLRKIEDVIIKTCIAVEPFMNDSFSKSPQHRNNCFELYGFDILVDDTLKPWLLEVNVCPSLSSSSPLDKKIKTQLISDILNTIGFIPYDKKKLSKEKNQLINRIQNKNKIYGNPIQKLGTTSTAVIIGDQQSIHQPNISQKTNTALNLNFEDSNQIAQNIVQSPPLNCIANSTNGFLFKKGVNSSLITSISNYVMVMHEKKQFSKNIKDIQGLNQYNCLQKLTADDWEVLFESDEEMYRSGEFQRIFPTEDVSLLDYYSQFFIFPRYNNIMLWNTLRSSVNILEYITHKHSTINC